jgi:hypothetical protein
MEPSPRGDQRYSPNQVEQDVLTAEIPNYFRHPKRSSERKAIAAQTAQKLSELNTAHQWTEKSVRIWFRNNRDRLVDKTGINSEYIEKKQARIARPLPITDGLCAPLSRASMSVDASSDRRFEIRVPGALASPHDLVSDRTTPPRHPNVEFSQEDPAIFPEVPTVEEAEQNGPDELYKVLRKYSRGVRSAAMSPPQIRQQRQPKLELRFVETLSRFRRPL